MFLLRQVRPEEHGTCEYCDFVRFCYSWHVHTLPWGARSRATSRSKGDLILGRKENVSVHWALAQQHSLSAINQVIFHISRRSPAANLTGRSAQEWRQGGKSRTDFLFIVGTVKVYDSKLR